MRVSDIQSGRVYTVEVERGSRTPFEGRNVLAVKNEVFLYKLEITGEILLRHATEDAWDIRGTDTKNKNILEEVIERNLPRLCWVVSVRPKKFPEILIVQVHEFPQRYQFPDDIQIGIDEKIIEDIHEKHLRNNAPVEKIIEWLTGEFLLPTVTEGDARRVLLQAGTSYQNGIENTFRLCGKERAINVRRNRDDKLIVDKIEKARQPKDYDEQRPVVLIEAQLSFCDISLAVTLPKSARTELDFIVEKSHSYLALWKEYNRLEQESILQKAQQFGWVRYDYQEMLHNGARRFRLLREDNLEERLKRLVDSKEVSLEASQQQPDFSPREGSKTVTKSFFGQIEYLNLYSFTIDIRPSNPDEDFSPPPKGFLFICLSGDRIRLARRQKAEERIRNAICPMPQLGLILENQRVPTRRTNPQKPLSKDSKKVFNGCPTLRQEEALKVALNTPDIALIQGPPGTGKTKVITALQVRLAEISENSGTSLSHRLLLTSYQHDAVENAAERTVVFGLPAVRIGGKASSNEAPDNLDRWRRSRIDALEAKLAALPELPENASLRQVQNLVASYILTPGNRQQTVALINQIFELTKGKIKGELSNRLWEYSNRLSRGQNLQNIERDEERELALKAVNSIRTDPVAFCDDGPMTAMKALRRLESLQVLKTSERQLLQNAAEWMDEEAPPFLPELALLRDRQDLIGYYNAFEGRFYESDFLKAIYEAQCAANRERIYIIILDEMNLSRPEQYFADFLSKLEQDSPTIGLTTDLDKPSPKLFQNGNILPIPPNVWFVGTANQDETTLELADKTYDRSHIMEVQRNRESFDIPVRPDARYPISYQALMKSFKNAQRQYVDKAYEAYQFLNQTLADFLERRFKVDWGNRLERQIKDFVPVVIAAGGSLGEATDHILATKILRKIRDRHDTPTSDLRQLKDDLLQYWLMLDEQTEPEQSLFIIDTQIRRLEPGED